MIDVKKIRQDFPMYRNGTLMQGKPLIWLDNASTTFKPDCVVKAVSDYLSVETSNAHRGDYDLCHNLDIKIGKAREKVASFINADSREIIFTSGTTGSLNTIAYGYGLSHLKEGDEILVSEEEHASNALPWFEVARLTGAKIKFIPLDNGRITAENLRKSITDRTKLVSIADVSNVLGYYVPVKEIAKVCHERGVLLSIDGAQSVPHRKTDVKDFDCDFLSFSGHKMCGPTGIGVLYGKYDVLKEMRPFETGGGMNVKFNNACEVTYYEPPTKFEAGTQNIEGILGLAAAVDYLQSIGMDNIHDHERELKKYAAQVLKKTPNAIVYNADSEAGIVTFNIDGVFSQDGATFLNSRGIAVRSGHHCAKMLDNVLGTIATLRASFYFYTSKEDIDELADAIAHGKEFLDAYF